MSSFDPIVMLPGLGETHFGEALRTGAAILAILVAAAILVRLAHVFVRGILRTLLNRENVEGTVRFAELQQELAKLQELLYAAGKENWQAAW